MQQFSDFGITTNNKGFIGDKIKIDRILNKTITVHDYKIDKSKFEGKGQCLHMQVEVDGSKRVIFTGSVGLIEVIDKIPKTGFPFQTTIIKDNERYQFT